MANLALRLQGHKGFDRLGEGHVTTPMEQVKIKTVDAQALQAALAGKLRGFAPGVVGIDLADQKNPVASAANRLTDELFGRPVAVHFGGIDQRHAEVDALLQGRNFLAAPGRILADHPGAHAQGRHLFSARQGNAFHTISTARKSLTLVSVGPVTMASPKAPKNPCPSLSARASLGWMPRSQARCSESGAR